MDYFVQMYLYLCVGERHINNKKPS